MDSQITETGEEYSLKTNSNPKFDVRLDIKVEKEPEEEQEVENVPLPQLFNGNQIEQSSSETLKAEEEQQVKNEPLPHLFNGNQIEQSLSETLPLSVFIKSEPLDDYEEETPECRGFVENVTVKVDPMCYSDEESQKALDLSSGSSLRRSSRNLYKPRKKIDYDEDYLPKPKKKKKQFKPKPDPGILCVKPAFQRKSKNPPENCFPESVTQHIDVVTISEEERQIEHRNAWHSRKHMKFTCEPCAAGYVLKEAYDIHMKMHSLEAGEFECQLCHTRAKSKDALYKHKLRHFRRYRCKICLVMYREKCSAESHVNGEHLGNAFICTICGKGYKRPVYLQQHMAQTHNKEAKFECPVCKLVVHERSRYRSHVRLHNKKVRLQTLQQSVICDYCMREFRNKTNLKRHLAVHVAAPVTCKLCLFACKNDRILRMHFKRVHTDQKVENAQICETERQCGLCFRVCASRGLLRVHMRRMHTDRTKKYQCDHCQRVYLTKGELRSHISWSHLFSLTHACECGRVFRTPALLRRHTEREHLQMAAPRDHQCELCDKAFTNKQVLKRHMKSHSDLMYPCNECGATFKTESYVKVHYKLKHLNMTRAQIKAEVKPKLLHMVHGLVRVAKRKKPKKNRQKTEEKVEEEREYNPHINSVIIKIEPASDNE